VKARESNIGLHEARRNSTLSSLVRKTFWPGAIAIGFLVFLGAIGYGPRSSAQVFTDNGPYLGDLCAIYGPEVITEGGPGPLYIGNAHEDGDEPSALFIGVIHGEDDDVSFGVDIDNLSGNTNITSVYDEDDDEYEVISPVNTVVGIDPVEAGEMGEVEDEWDVDLGDFVCDLEAIDEEDLADDLDVDIKAKINNGENVLNCVSTGGQFNNIFSIPTTGPTACPYDPGEDSASTVDIDCPDATPTDPPFCSIDGSIIDAVVAALVDEISDGSFSCSPLALAAKNAALNAGATVAIAEQFVDAIYIQCFYGAFDVFLVEDP
jgi:hypothetical protein